MWKSALGTASPVMCRTMASSTRTSASSCEEETTRVTSPPSISMGGSVSLPVPWP